MWKILLRPLAGELRHFKEIRLVKNSCTQKRDGKVIWNPINNVNAKNYFVKSSDLYILVYHNKLWLEFPNLMTRCQTYQILRSTVFFRFSQKSDDVIFMLTNFKIWYFRARQASCDTIYCFKLESKNYTVSHNKRCKICGW